MTEGTNQGLFVVVGIIIFGIFVSLGYMLFRDTLTPALSSMFEDSNEKSLDIINGNVDLAYEEWVDERISEGYIMTEDSDYSGDKDGEFKYIGNNKKVIVPKIIKGVTLTNTSMMFSNSNIEGVALNNSNVTNMYRMFANSQATTLKLSSFVTSNVTNMNGMFHDSQVTTLDLSSFDTSKVTNMYQMFNGSQAKILDLSNFNTTNVSNMYGMFYQSQATTIEVSSFNTSTVTNMSLMFSESKSTTLDLASFDTYNVTNMDRMFRESNATTLDLSSFDTSNVTNMDRMFKDSKATTGYAENQEEVTKFNNTSEKPSTLTFVLK